MLNQISKLVFTGLFATTIALAFAGQTLAADAVAGQKAFKLCTACHKIGPDAKNSVGPQLNGIFGRAAGSAEGYKYSKHLRAAGEKGLVWDAAELDKWLTDPKTYLRTYLDDKKARSKMVTRVKNDEKRANIIAYLESLLQ